jgi:hypothetical protein
MLAIFAPLTIGLFFVWILTSAIESASAVQLPFQFTADIYDATPGEVCPGDTITWQRTVIVNAPVNTVTTRLWIDPTSQRSMAIRDSTRQFLFVSNQALEAYYLERFGREIAASNYPLTVSEVLTAVVPVMVSGGPLVLEETTILEARLGDEYLVPIWVLTSEECLAGGR